VGGRKPETLDSRRSSPGYDRPSLDSSQVAPRSSLRQTPAPCHSLAAAATSSAEAGSWIAW
jgi:hypothetical protein